jgi:HAD superfamily hydrolase (TIGR01548 family)
MKGVLVFDMDGVLVDVTESYRETIRHTVHRFTKQEISPELIQDYKNQGGWNNDWLLSQKICSDLGVKADYGEVVEVFQSIFFGPNQDGLVLRERWLPKNGLLERLAGAYALTIFTGRLRDEAGFTLRRFASDIPWTAVVGDDDVENSKPAPDGLLKIAADNPEASLTYVGDTVDDARSARLARVRFIGIAHANNPRRPELIRLLEDEGAVAVIENINELESVL